MQTAVELKIENRNHGDFWMQDLDQGIWDATCSFDRDNKTRAFYGTAEKFARQRSRYVAQ
jgi:hypothetical protein